VSRKQNGFIFHKGPSWFVRYSDNIRQKDGSVRWQQVCRKLPVPYGDQFRSKKSVQKLADDVLAPINNGTINPNSTMLLTDFVETVWLPYIEGQVRPYTARCYRQLWQRHLRDRVSNIALRDFRTVHAYNLLNDIARPQTLSKSTLQHLKNLLSGIFRDAKNLGFLDGDNPITGTRLPRTVRETEATHAYGLDEVNKMLLAVSGPAKTIIMLAAYSGLRRSEIRGLRCGDYNGRELTVQRSVVESDTNATKNAASKAPIPICTQLRVALDAHIVQLGPLATPNAPLFPAGNGRPLNLKNLVKRVILPALEGTGVDWSGWHGFRRGLATVLHAAGVDDRTISTICRHSNVAITQQLYIKSVTKTQVDAMNVFGAEVEKAANCNENGTAQTLVN
jgi:integrase